MKVGEFCTRKIITVSRGESLLSAARVMCRHNAGEVIVVEERHGSCAPVGILTDRDIVLRLLAAGSDPAGLSVEETMSRELATIPEEQELSETISHLKRGRCRKAAVVAADGALVGLLTLDDVANLVSEELSQLLRLLPTGEGGEEEA